MSGQDHMGREPVNAPIFPKPPVVALLFIAAGFALARYVPIVETPPTLPIESVIVGCSLIPGLASSSQ